MGKKIFKRNSTGELRAEGDARTLTGYPIVFGLGSVDLPDEEHGWVREVIEPGAVSDDLLMSDVICNINHDDDQMIGRCTGGKGTLRLERDEHGVKMSVETPNTVYGDIAYEGTKRGDFRGMSFAFWLDADKDVSYTRGKADGKEVWVRHINKIRGLMDVSIVTRPAYPDTEVDARAQKEPKQEPKPEPEERNEEMKRDWELIEKAKKGE